MALPAIKVSATALSAALVKADVPAQPTGDSFLRFDGKEGGWTNGREQESVDDEIILVNTTTLGKGWVLWIDSQPKAKRVVSFTEAMPEPMDGENTKVKKNGKMVDEFVEPIEMRVFQGAFFDNGDPVTFETSSYSGRGAIDGLLAEIKQKAIEGSQFLFPAVKLGQSSYFNKTHKTTIYTPVLEIVSWHDQEGNEEGAPAKQLEQEQEQEQAPAAKPARKPRTPKAKAEPEPQEEEAPAAAAPQRRRRTVNA